MNNRAYYGNNIPNSPIYNGNSIPEEPVINNSFNMPTTYELPIEKSYIENILRLNKGKEVIVYMTFPNSNQKEFKGIIETNGSDHIIVSDPSTGKWHLLPIMYVDFITFDEKINYSK